MKTSIKASTKTASITRAVRSFARNDDGIGIVIALAVSVVIALLGSTWYAMSIQELDETTFDIGRTGAINMAEAGAREAMYLLANDETFRLDAATTTGANSGITTGVCDMTAVDSQINLTVRQVGEFWYRAEKIDPADPLDYRYLIESWGWSPGHDSRQAVAKKVMFEVELDPFGNGFDHAVFASGAGLTAGNRKEIYGDMYSAEDLVLDNFTRAYVNDSGYPGNGNLEVVGDLEISGGSNVDIEGYVKVNGYIDDNKVGSTYRDDVIILHDNPASARTVSYFRNATIAETIFAAAPATDVTGTISTATEVYNATGIAPVPSLALPAFTWDASSYTPAGVVYPSWADFDTWYSANKGALSGAHYVQDAGSYLLDFNGAYLTDHFLLAFDGSLTVKKTPSGSALAPAQIVLIGMNTTSDIILGQAANSIENVVHHLIKTEGSFGASNQSTIYGALYGYSDISTNRLEIHFRPPEDAIIGGFTFDPTAIDYFRPIPGVWRETPPLVDAVGITMEPSGYHCSLP